MDPYKAGCSDPLLAGDVKSDPESGPEKLGHKKVCIKRNLIWIEY